MNWGAIANTFIALFLADFLAGFITGSSSLFVGLSLSFVLSSLVFALLSYHQATRPFLHSAVAFFLYFAFSQLLSLVLPTWLNSPPLVGTLSWLTTLLALAFGTAAATVAAQAKDLKIGVVVPISGPFAAHGKQIKHGIDLFLAAHGDTVAGRHVEIIYKDDTRRVTQQ